MGLVLRTNVGGTATEWAALDIANIGATGFAAGQVIRRNGGNNAWEPFTPVAYGPRFLGAPLNVYTGGAIGWTTYGASSATLSGKSAAILQVVMLWNTSDDGQVTVMSRPSSGGIETTIGRIGATDAIAGSSQVTIPITADGKFDYEIITAGTAIPNVTIDLIGYYL